MKSKKRSLKDLSKISFKFLEVWEYKWILQQKKQLLILISGPKDFNETGLSKNILTFGTLFLTNISH